MPAGISLGNSSMRDPVGHDHDESAEYGGTGELVAGTGEAHDAHEVGGEQADEAQRAAPSVAQAVIREQCMELPQ